MPIVSIAENEDDLQRLLHTFHCTTKLFNMSISTTNKTHDNIPSKLVVEGIPTAGNEIQIHGNRNDRI